MGLVDQIFCGIVIATENIDSLNPEQLRLVLRALQTEVARKDEIIVRQEREAALHEGLRAERCDFGSTAASHQFDKIIGPSPQVLHHPGLPW